MCIKDKIAARQSFGPLSHSQKKGYEINFRSVKTYFDIQSSARIILCYHPTSYHWWNRGKKANQASLKQETEDRVI